MNNGNSNTPLRPPIAGQNQATEASEAEPARYLTKRNDLHRRPRVVITERQRTDFIPPNSLEEAESELTSVLTKIELIRGELIAKTAPHPTFTDEQVYHEWKKRAEIAISWARARRILLTQWIEKHRLQSNKEEVANFVAPTSLEEAHTKLTSVKAEMLLMKGDAAGKIREDFSGIAEFRAWKSTAEHSFSRLKVLKLQLENWILSNTPSKPPFKQEMTNPIEFEVPQVSFETPASIEDAETQLAQLTADVLAMQKELSRVNGLVDPKERRDRKAGIMLQMLPKLAQEKVLGTWVKQQHRRQRDEVAARRSSMMENFDPDNPVSLVYHSYNLVCRILKQTGIVVTGRDANILDGIREHLRKNGLST